LIGLPDPLTILSTVFGASYKILEKLREKNGIPTSGVIIDYERSEIEYNFMINLGDTQSRKKTITKHLSAIANKKITIDDVSQISGVALPTNEDLRKLGIITLRQRTATLDFPALFKKIQGNLVTISFKKSFPRELTNKLVYRNIGKVSRRTEKGLESNLEIILDNANMWRTQFTSFSVRNIIFTINISIDKNTILTALPEKLKDKLILADQESGVNSNAKKFLARFQRLISEFQDEDFLNEISKSVLLDPSFSFILKDIRTTMQGYSLTKSGMPLMLPGKIILTIESHIEDDQKSLHGTAFLDIQSYSNTFNVLLKKIESETNNIKL